MVISTRQHSEKAAAQQGAEAAIPEPTKIGACTPYDFHSKNLTAYGGLLPVATMLEKLEFQRLLEQTLTVKRVTRSMTMYQFVLAMVLALYVGFSRLNHLRFLAREPMLVGILKVLRLPPQCTFWRFLASLHLQIARQLLEVQRVMRQRVWEAAHIRLTAVTLDTDTTVHTLFGHQMGARKGYNPKNKGKKSYQPILTFLAETREYIAGELHNGDRPSGAQIARHLENVFAALPQSVPTMYARADSGFYCWEAVDAYESQGCQFILSARKTARLVDQLKGADWKGSPRTDADGQCEFRYRPEGWGQAYRFIALRYEKRAKLSASNENEQYQLFDTPEYTYRVFVTNMKDPLLLVALRDDKLDEQTAQHVRVHTLYCEICREAFERLECAAPKVFEFVLRKAGAVIDWVRRPPNALADLVPAVAVRSRDGGLSFSASFRTTETVADPDTGAEHTVRLRVE